MSDEDKSEHIFRIIYAVDHEIFHTMNVEHEQRNIRSLDEINLMSEHWNSQKSSASLSETLMVQLRTFLSSISTVPR